MYGVSSDALVWLASGISSVKKLCGLVGLCFDLGLSRVCTGVAAMGQDYLPIGYHKIGEEKENNNKYTVRND